MRNVFLALAASTIAAPAFAGGVERSAQPMSILFEEGRYLEFGASYARPDVSGTVSPLLGGVPTGNIANSFFTGSIGYKADLGKIGLMRSFLTSRSARMWFIPACHRLER